MPIVTKPTTVTKGADGVFTLDKTALAALSSVAGNSYYSDVTNWKRVIVFFKSNPGNQKTHIEFDATLSSPTGKFHTSSHARDTFEVQYVVIEDFDGGTFPVARASLTATDFDVTLAGAAPTGVAYRYLKVQVLEAFAGGASGTTALSSSVSMTELQLKYDGAVQSLVGKTVSGYSPMAGAFSVSNLADGAIPTDNTGFNNWPASWSPQITVDLSVAKVVTDVLMAPQGDLGPAQVYNVPKKFEVFGSNDGITFTSIKVIDQASYTYGQSPSQWYPGHITTFSLA